MLRKYLNKKIVKESKIPLLSRHINNAYQPTLEIYNGKWNNQIRAWKVERQAETATQNNQPPVSIEPFPPMPDTDALPFGNDNEPPF